jgi:hypothetical protein
MRMSDSEIRGGFWMSRWRTVVALLALVLTLCSCERDRVEPKSKETLSVMQLSGVVTALYHPLEPPPPEVRVGDTVRIAIQYDARLCEHLASDSFKGVYQFHPALQNISQVRVGAESAVAQLHQLILTDRPGLEQITVYASSSRDSLALELNCDFEVRSDPPLLRGVQLPQAPDGINVHARGGGHGAVRRRGSGRFVGYDFTVSRLVSWFPSDTVVLPTHDATSSPMRRDREGQRPNVCVTEGITTP